MCLHLANTLKSWTIVIAVHENGPFSLECRHQGLSQGKMMSFRNPQRQQRCSPSPHALGTPLLAKCIMHAFLMRGMPGGPAVHFRNHLWGCGPVHSGCLIDFCQQVVTVPLLSARQLAECPADFGSGRSEFLILPLDCWGIWGRTVAGIGGRKQWISNCVPGTLKFLRRLLHASQQKKSGMEGKLSWKIACSALQTFSCNVQLH